MYKRQLQVLRDNGGIYLDTDAIVLKSFAPLLRNASFVLGRQYTGEVAVGTMAAAPHHWMLNELLDQMCRRYDGEWVTHSIDMFTQFFERHHHTHTQTHRIYDNRTFFPMTWSSPQRWIHGDHIDWDWDKTYAFHLYHSNSEPYLRQYATGQRRGPSILRKVIRQGLGHTMKDI